MPGKLIRYLGRPFIEQCRDIRSEYYLKKNSSPKYNKNRPIRVAFIVQMAEIWDKQKSVYENMRGDSRFETKLIVVPPFDFVEKKVRTDYFNNYFLENYSNALKAYSDGNWIKIGKEIDYVFYQRPYDEYLPKTLRSDSVVKSAKCCYIPYAMWPLREMLCGYNRRFFRNIYFAFIDSEENALTLLRYGNYKGRILFRGFPELENIKQSTIINTVKNVLWAPRWSYSDNVGGSHFFEYKDEILRLKEYYDDINLTIRPHPLAFDNYISQGLMTIEEKEMYLESVEKSKAIIDKNANIEDTFKSTDVLITDISSIIFHFFLSGKPIIYCKANVEVSASFAAIQKGLYIADNWEDVLACYKKLYAGQDPLKSVRIEIGEKIKEKNLNATYNIVNTIVSDYISTI